MDAWWNQIWARVREGIAGRERKTSSFAFQGTDNRCVIHSVNNAVGRVVNVSHAIQEEHPRLYITEVGPSRTPLAFVNAQDIVRNRDTRKQLPELPMGFPLVLISELLRDLKLQSTTLRGVPKEDASLMPFHVFDFEDIGRIANHMLKLNFFAVLISLKGEGDIGHMIAMRYWKDGHQFRVQDSDPRAERVENPAMVWGGRMETLAPQLIHLFNQVGLPWSTHGQGVRELYFLKESQTTAIPIGAPLPEMPTPPAKPSLPLPPSTKPGGGKKPAFR